MIHLLVAVGSRANWSSAKSICAAAKAHPGVELSTVAFASALSREHGATLDHMQEIGCSPRLPVHSLSGSEGYRGMCETVGRTLERFPDALDLIEPDVVLVVGDRHEIMGPAFAAHLGGYPLAQTMGGEVSGTVDDATRDAVSVLSVLHFPATYLSAQKLRANEFVRGEVHLTGCPRIDLVKAAIAGLDTERKVPRTPPFVMVSLHPDTDQEEGYNVAMMEAVVRGCEQYDGEVHLFWPNADAHGDAMRSAARRILPSHWQTHRTMSPEDYSRMMAQADCLVGNSSSGLREGAFIGTPVVNVGDRQQGRECGDNVVRCPALDSQTIAECVAEQVAHGLYASDPLYGTGNAGEQIVEVLAS